jgi:diguanylate cyclase (GGDEF)-like protein/PAS domain S-box-containing protein
MSDNTIVIALDKDKRVTHVHGCSASVISETTKLSDVAHPVNQLSQYLDSVYAGEKVVTGLSHADKHYQAVALPVHHNGVVNGCAITLSSITPPLTSTTHDQLLPKYSSDFVTTYQLDGQCNYASPSISTVLGYQPDEITGQTVLQFMHPDDKKSKRRLMGKLLDNNFEKAINYRVRHKDGHYVWLETFSKPLENDDGSRISEILALSRDVTERKENEERLTYLANYDSLTGLPNRTLFRDRLGSALARAKRSKSQFALFFLDLDRFKNINDSLGHHAGDELLRGVSKRLEQFARKNDTIARLGGDEFTIILEDINGPEDASLVAQKILEIMTPAFILDGHEVVASPSIGITIYPDDASDMQSLLKNADTAMYQSKDKGRNRYQFYTADMNAKAYEHLILENALRHALEREEFRLYFQPQIDLHTEGVIGIEALVRWQHPEKGLISPDEFVPFAEDTGLIHPIGEWVLNAACQELVRWREAGIAPLPIALNLSMRQFLKTSFVDMIQETLNKSDIDPALIELEITESFLAHNADQTALTLHKLRDLGIKISVDDFGTGYSSLSYLKKFPLNTLKIDKSFIKDISTDPDGATIAEAIIGLGKSLRLNVIAEGVESEDQVFFLRSRGCDRVQGFLFSRPLSSADIMEWLKKNRSRRIVFEQHDLWPETPRSNKSLPTRPLGV